MRLTDLQPAWITPDMFIFRSPVGEKDWLTCKRVVMPRNAQFGLIDEFKEKHPEYKGIVVASHPEVAWKFEGNDFNTLTVTPSIDAHESGNWHGHITNGMIVGGI